MSWASIVGFVGWLQDKHTFYIILQVTPRIERVCLCYLIWFDDMSNIPKNMVIVFLWIMRLAMSLMSNRMIDFNTNMIGKYFFN